MMKKIIAIVIFMMLMVSWPIHDGSPESKYSIKEMTPEVKAALDNRRDRYDLLKELKAKGSIGETNRGIVKVLKDQEGAVEIVEAENRDRKIIYKTIAQQNGWKSKQRDVYMGTEKHIMVQIKK